MRITMCMIVRDAAGEIVETLDSFYDQVDEVIVVDTGSEDNTVNVLKQYAEDNGEWVELTDIPPKKATDWGAKLVIAHWTWADDFAAARTYADTLATGDWLSWADHDDTVHGMDSLRKLAGEADPRISGLFVAYEYAMVNDRCVCELWRERLVRKGTSQWVDRVHESQIVHGPVVKVDREIARWTHRKPPFTPSDRNTLILERWLEDEPQNPRVLANLARDHMSNGRAQDAVPLYERYLQHRSQPAETRAQAARQLCCALMTMGRWEWAKENALRAFEFCPTWPDTYLTLAEIAAATGDWNGVIFHTERVLALGAPDTLLIVNPQDYDQKPKAMIAQALANLGKINEACELAEQVDPQPPDFAEMLAGWQATRQRDQTAGMWAQCAQLLVNYDEPLKARRLLETVPHYAVDHPTVVAARVQARDAIETPYVVEPVVDGPRAEFLVNGLAEHAGKVTA